MKTKSKFSHEQQILFEQIKQNNLTLGCLDPINMSEEKCLY